MRFIMLIIIVLIAYGSLYPFRFSGNGPGTDEAINWLFNLGLHTTKSDITANILLFVPYGFVGRLCLNTFQQKFKGALVFLLAGVVLAFVLQYIQFYLPSRIPSAADALLNSLGIILGLGISHLIMQYSQTHIPRDSNKRTLWSQVSIPILIGLIWICWRWFPYIPMVSTDSILEGLRPLINKPQLNFGIILRDSIGWLMFYFLVSQPPFNNLPRFRLFKIAFYVIGLEVFIVSNQLTVNDLLAALGAYALYTSLDEETLQHMLVWCLAVALFLTWMIPFSFTGQALDISWIPFASLLKGNPWAHSELLMLKLFYIAGFIWLLRVRWLGWGMATSLTAGLVFILLVIQKYLGGLRPDITDLIIVAVCGWTLYQVERQASQERILAMQ